MTNFLRNRNRQRPPRYVLVERTTRWERVGDEFCQLCVVDVDGVRRLVAVRSDLVAGAA